MRQRYYFLDWNSNGEKFLENVTLTPQVQYNVQIYIVYSSKEIPAKLLPQFRSLHVPRNAVLIALKDAKWERVVRRLTWQSPRCSIVEEKDVVLVSTEPRKCFDKLMDLLTSKEVDYKLIHLQNVHILDEFSHKCIKCRMIFATKKGLKKHDDKFCGYFAECLTSSGKHKVGFNKAARKVKEAKECVSCLNNCVLTYCPHRDRAEDMAKIQKTRYVGKTHDCESTYDSVNYTSHFLYGYEKLPCLAVSGCSGSFSSLQDQAHHHVTEHGCLRPYFCIVCYRMLKTINFETEAELLFHGRLKSHCEAEFCFA